ncbi:MAG: GspMb/PilO family protein [Candidatus Acidiferrales bacterium]|jgi:Tfp pilus assembly protein PilO
MTGKWQSWKKWTGIALALLLLADGALAGYLWQLSQQGPEEIRAERNRLETQARLFKADVARGEKIRASLPQVKGNCDAFYNESFLDRITGYSDIETDLDSIATKAGVKTSGFSFKQKDVKERGVTEISIETSVEADYPAVIQFINGLERSKYFYLLDDLQLGSASTGGIRLQIGLHTYFRT